MSKLNPLKTKHELTVSIDDIEYPFTFKPLNTKDQKELDAFRISQRANYELYDEKRAEQKELLEIKSLNEEILKDDSFTEKAKILFEQKNIVSKISILEKEIKSLSAVRDELESDIEEYYKRYFDLCVVGAGKIAFEKAINDSGISYSLISNYINEALREAVEKK